MRFHWQNLNENGRWGGALREGRCWWHFGKDGEKTVGLSWNIPTHFWHAEATLGGDYSEDDLMVSVGCGLFAVWLHTERVLPRMASVGHNGRQMGVSVHNGGIWFHLWHDTMEWRRSDPWWWHFTIYPLDLLLGKTVYSTQKTGSERASLQMPEASYDLTVEFSQATWKRPRWPWPKRMVRADVQLDVPIPFPGKGENSWDQGEDALFSLSCAATTTAEAVQRTVDFVRRRRQRYGGKDWRPAKTEIGG